MKVQVSIEFIVIVTLLLTMLTIISITSIVKTREIEISTVMQETENLLELVGNSINTVYLEGNGFSTNVTLPDRIVNANYTVTIDSGFLVITAQGNSFSKILLTDNIFGQLSNGTFTITNLEGMVVIQ